jgi:N-sulfoglucosamine sulfohydrolase
MDELREEMFAMLRKENDPRALGNGAIFDTYKYTGPRRHSYDNWLEEQSAKENK